MTIDLPDIIGLSGVLLTLVAYFLLQTSLLKVEGVLYSLVNACGSGLILYSLFFQWNTSAAVMEIAWLAISLYGAFKAFQKRKQIKTSSE